MARPARAPARIPRLPAGSPAHPRESSALTLTIVFTGLVIYASLYPFSGWFWPAGQPLSALLVPPWPRYHVGFDDWSNFAGYMPMGALVYASALRRGRGALAACVVAVVLPSALSWVMEFTQHFLPGRYPSLMDWTLNTLGAVAGLSLGVVVHSAGAGVRWSTLRERWFLPRSGATIALLLLWPVGFLYPSTVPFGQGVSWERLQEAAYDLLNDHPLAPWFDWLWASLGENTGPMSKAAEGFAVALGLLGPCMVAFAITRPGWRRAAVVPWRWWWGWRPTRCRRRSTSGRCMRSAGSRPPCRRGWRWAASSRWRSSSSASGRRRRWAWWRCRWAWRWWPRRRPTRTTPTACSNGSRAASSISTAWRSGWAGCGRSPPARRFSGD